MADFPADTLTLNLSTYPLTNRYCVSILSLVLLTESCSVVCCTLRLLPSELRPPCILSLDQPCGERILEDPRYH